MAGRPGIVEEAVQPVDVVVEDKVGNVGESCGSERICRLVQIDVHSLVLLSELCISVPGVVQLTVVLQSGYDRI